MKIKPLFVLGAVLLPLVAGAASTPKTLAPVGPEPSCCRCAATGVNGYLTVFTATQKSAPLASDDSWRFDLHTGYDLYDQAGKLLKFVPNHASDLDESPDRVTLADGQYKIVALSGQYGRVTVPVIIENGKSTVVHLE